jgi:hypothetical protein
MFVDLTLFLSQKKQFCFSLRLRKTRKTIVHHGLVHPLNLLRRLGILEIGCAKLGIYFFGNAIV